MQACDERTRSAARAHLVALFAPTVLPIASFPVRLMVGVSESEAAAAARMLDELDDGRTLGDAADAVEAPLADCTRGAWERP